MKIGLISDTHVPAMGKEPPPQVTRAFQGVDLILHAGHANVPSCLDWLGRIAPVKASESFVEGTGEAPMRVSQVQVVEVEGHSIGLVHELFLPGMDDDLFPGAIAKRYPAEKSLPMALQGIFGKPVDIVVFGATHVALVELHQGVLMVNPGSPPLLGQIQKLGTVAILELTPESRETRIINLAELEKDGELP